MRDACHALGIGFVIWMTRSGQPENDFDFTPEIVRQACSEVAPDGVIAEAEIPAQIREGENVRPNPQAQNWPALAHVMDDFPEIDRAVATSWAPFRKWQKIDGQWREVPAPEFAKALITKGWKVMPYVYPAETPTHSVAGAVAYSRNYTHEAAPSVLAAGDGWYRPEPVAGVYGGKTLLSPEFDGIEECAGFSIWDAGEEF